MAAVTACVAFMADMVTVILFGIKLFVRMAAAARRAAVRRVFFLDLMGDLPLRCVQYINNKLIVKDRFGHANHHISLQGCFNSVIFFCKIIAKNYGSSKNSCGSGQSKGRNE